MPNPPPRAGNNCRLIFESHLQAAMLRAAQRLSTHRDVESGVSLCRCRFLRKVLRLEPATHEQAFGDFQLKDFALRALNPRRKCDADPTSWRVLPAKFQDSTFPAGWRCPSQSSNWFPFADGVSR